MVKYEKFEEWLLFLKAGDKKTTVYVDVARMKPSENLVSLNVVFQVISQNWVHCCIVSDGMPVVDVVPEWVFSILSDPKLANDALVNYRMSLELFEKKVMSEYEKAVGIIKKEGFSNIVMGVVQ